MWSDDPDTDLPVWEYALEDGRMTGLSLSVERGGDADTDWVPSYRSEMTLAALAFAGA